MVSSDDEDRSKRGGSIQLKDGGQRFGERMRHEARNYIRFRRLENLQAARTTNHSEMLEK
jgi:hypothetical protein